MIKKITMPAGGQTTDQSLIAEWFVKKGDKVKRGDLLLNVETDKTVLEVESFATGIVIDILIQQGETASSGDILALIGDENDLALYKKKPPETVAASNAVPADTIDDYRPIMPKSASAKTLSNTSAIQTHDIKVLPNAKKYALENNIDLVAFAKNNNLKIVKLADLKAASAAHQTTTSKTTGCILYNDVPHSSMRRTIAIRMLESAQNIPSYHVTLDIDMTACIEFRTTLNNRQNDIKVGYNHIIMKAISLAVKKFPNINASWTETTVRQYANVNIGLAVSLDNGLVVPVIAETEKLGILQIALETNMKITKARAGKLASHELTGGTITLSNMGMYPIQNFTAIINPPEACILALGCIQDRPIIHKGKMNIAPVMTITATFDHRVIDGAYGAQFLNELKQLIEMPALLSC